MEKIKIKIAVFLVLIPGLMLCIKCKKDDNSSNVNYRIVGSDSYLNDTLTGQDIYEYEGERLITKWEYNFGDQPDTGKMVIDYLSSQSAVVTLYNKVGGELLEWMKLEMDFQDNLMTQNTSYFFDSDLWEPFTKITWQYEKGKIVEILHHTYQSGSYKTHTKIDYEYSKGNIKRMLLYYNSISGWLLYWKEEYEHDGGKVKSIVGYDYFDEAYHEAVKYEFSYTGNTIMSMEQFFYENGTWGPKNRTWNYLFDPSGNLSSYSVMDQEGTYKVEFHYEEGKGNYQQIFNYPVGQTYDVLPRPTKSVNPMRNFSLAGAISSKLL